jgi:acetolactate synthase-1/2/3 large subunit
MQAQQFFKAVRDCLPQDAIVVLDANVSLSIGQTILSAKSPCSWLDPGWNGCMGAGIPMGMAAKLACPDRHVVVICGDFAFGVSAIDTETLVRHRIPITVLVANNNGINAGMKQAALFPREYDELFSRFPPDLRYERIMDAFGGHAEFVTEPEEIRPALERASAAGVATCINVRINPETSHPGSW